MKTLERIFIVAIHCKQSNVNERFQATDEYNESIEEDQAILNEAFDSFQSNYQQPSENSTFLANLSRLSSGLDNLSN